MPKHIHLFACKACESLGRARALHQSCRCIVLYIVYWLKYQFVLQSYNVMIWLTSNVKHHDLPIIVARQTWSRVELFGKLMHVLFFVVVGLSRMREMHCSVSGSVCRATETTYDLAHLGNQKKEKSMRFKPQWQKKWPVTYKINVDARFNEEEQEGDGSHC